MKKLLLTSLVAVFAATAANAGNYFVGGAADFSSERGDHNTSWSVTPYAGISLNDRWDVGAYASIEYANRPIIFQEGEPAENVDKYDYSFGGFARYKIVQFGDFAVKLHGQLGATAITYYGGNDFTETQWALEAAVVPMLTYDLSKSFMLYTRLDFMGLNAEYRFRNKHLEDKNWAIDGGVQSLAIERLGNLMIGFEYKF